jgi:hypothetical protein
MRILGHEYTVSYGEFRQMEAAAKCDPHSQQIIIARDLSQSMRDSALIHEVLEAFNYHLELGIEHPAIARLEAGLYQFFSDNGISLKKLR